MSINIKRLKELRTGLSWSQADLARKAGVPKPTIGAIEAGNSKRPSYPTIKAIADALGIEPDELFFKSVG